jgi:hypothetical protein
LILNGLEAKISMPGINLKLQGQFKFDIYDSNKQLIKSSEFVDNFITNTGVIYPYHFAFADCFRYLSLGSGSSQNSTVRSGPYSTTETTGLSIPIPNFSYIGGRSKFDAGVEGTYYSIPGDFGAGCGNIQNPDGVSLVRQWTLPDNLGNTFVGPYNFQEFMVSPGRPYVTGQKVGDEIPQFCHCNESDDYATGLDCSAVSEYYDWLSDRYLTKNTEERLKICEAEKAFARILYPISVPNNSVLNVTYKLNIIFDTGINLKSLYYNNPDSNDGNWTNYLNSYSNITQPGIKLINDGTISKSLAPNLNKRLQHYNYTGQGRRYVFENEYGESFVPPMGAPLEPSNVFFLNDLNNQNIAVYLSNDNTEFLVSYSGGAFSEDTGLYQPWNQYQYQDNTVYSYGEIVSSGDGNYEYINPEPSNSRRYIDLNDENFWQFSGTYNVYQPWNELTLYFSGDIVTDLYPTPFTSGGIYYTSGAFKYISGSPSANHPIYVNGDLSIGYWNEFKPYRNYPTFVAGKVDYYPPNPVVVSGDLVQDDSYLLYKCFTDDYPIDGKVTRPLTDTDYWSYYGQSQIVHAFWSGIKPFRNENSATLLSSEYWTKNPNSYNIRKSGAFLPNPIDVTQSIVGNIPSFGATKVGKPIFSPKYINKIDAYNYDGVRTGQVVYTYNFSNYKGTNPLYTKSFVAGYKDITLPEDDKDSVNIVPFFDAIFSGTPPAKIFVPTMTTGYDILGNIKVTIDDPGSTDNFYLINQTNSLYPIFNNVLTWTVPCPPGTIGC